MKLLERVMEQKFRQKTKVSANQFGFMPGRTAMDAISSLRQLIKKKKLPREKEKNPYDLYHRSRESLQHGTKRSNLVGVNKRSGPKRLY